MGERKPLDEVIKARRRLPPAVWAMIRSRAEAGERMAALAVEYGLKAASIHKRAYVEDWQTPSRGGPRGRKPAARSEKNEQTVPPPGNGGNASNQAAFDDPPAPRSPAEVQDLVGNRLEQVILASLPAIETTGSPRELATLVDVFRKMRGLDGRNSAPTGPRLHAPRSIGRPAPLAPPAAPQDFEIE